MKREKYRAMLAAEQNQADRPHSRGAHDSDTPAGVCVTISVAKERRRDTSICHDPADTEVFLKLSQTSVDWR